MEMPASRNWLWVAILVAIVYPIVGITFALPTNPSASHNTVVAWRLAAWLVSATAFAAHLVYEHTRLHNAPLRAALHTSLAVALGGFLMAVWILLHARLSGSTSQSPLAPLALVIFPVVTGVPAFLAAFVTLTILARIRQRGQ